jgi:SAM-dependent methyltransferase
MTTFESTRSPPVRNHVRTEQERAYYALNKLTFRQADATELPFRDTSFDASCISFALHEVRVTKPGGRVVVVDYGRRPGRLGNVLHQVVKLYERDHYADFVASDLGALLRQAGVDVNGDRLLLHGAVRVLDGYRRNEEARGGPDHQSA